MQRIGEAEGRVGYSAQCSFFPFQHHREIKGFLSFTKSWHFHPVRRALSCASLLRAIWFRSPYETITKVTGPSPIDCFSCAKSLELLMFSFYSCCPAMYFIIVCIIWLTTRIFNSKTSAIRLEKFEYFHDKTDMLRCGLWSLLIFLVVTNFSIVSFRC